jgi:hypothetical protein
LAVAYPCKFAVSLSNWFSLALCFN